MLFKLRYQGDETRERNVFVQELNLEWEVLGEQEKRDLAENLRAAAGGLKRIDEESWVKVAWEHVPDLVQSRAVYIRAGLAYVPSKEQVSMIVAEFTSRLDKALEVRGSGMAI